MLRTTKNMKEKYVKIQKLIFSLIPEKWEEMYLYASAIVDNNSKQSGEMFFYYLPKGILKKRYVNVYEVPQRFKISEEQYLKVVESLYTCIKELKQDFIDTEQELWTSVTISIVDFKFRIEFNYDSIPLTEEKCHEKRVIWRYKYLKIGGEKKEERQILDEFFAHPKRVRKEIYETELYQQAGENKIDFNKDEKFKEPQEVIVYEKEGEPSIEDIQEDSSKEDEEEIHPNRNQILN